MKEKAAETAEELRQAGRERLEQTKEQTRSRLERTKDTAASQVDQLADVAGDVAGRLESQNDSLASYAGELASSMHRLADDLRNRSIDDLVAQTQDIARRNPTLFLMGSIAIGVALSRFMKASAERSRERELDQGYAMETRQSDDYGYTPPIGTATGQPIESPAGAPPGELH